MATRYTDGQRAKLPVSIIRTDRGTQSRDKTSPATIAEYAALMREGVEFEPVTVFELPDGELVLARGFHRLPAAIDAGRGDIDAIIRLGTLADAKWDSAGSNKHGLRCTSADYEKAVALALSAKPKASDREIARHLGIDGKTAAKYRPTAEASAVQTRVGKDGKERKLPAKKPPKVEPPVADKPKSAPPLTVKRDRDGSGDDSFDPVPADDVPAVQVEVVAPQSDPPKGQMPPAAIGTLLRSEEVGPAPRDDDETSFDVAAQSTVAARTVNQLIEAWPARHWPTLSGILKYAGERIAR